MFSQVLYGITYWWKAYIRDCEHVILSIEYDGLKQVIHLFISVDKYSQATVTMVTLTSLQTERFYNNYELINTSTLLHQTWVFCMTWQDWMFLRVLSDLMQHMTIHFRAGTARHQKSARTHVAIGCTVAPCTVTLMKPHRKYTCISRVSSSCSNWGVQKQGVQSCHVSRWTFILLFWSDDTFWQRERAINGDPMLATKYEHPRFFR